MSQQVWGGLLQGQGLGPRQETGSLPLARNGPLGQNCRRQVSAECHLSEKVLACPGPLGLAGVLPPGLGGDFSGPPELPRRFPRCSLGGGSIAELSPATQESWI